MLIADTGIAIGCWATGIIGFSIGGCCIDVILTSSFLWNDYTLAVRIRLATVRNSIAIIVPEISRSKFVARCRVGKTKCLRFEHLANAKVCSLYGPCFVIIVFMFVAVNMHPHLHNWVALNINTHIANLLANDDSVFYWNVPAIEITDKFAERLRASVDIH